MESQEAVHALSALAQQSRLEAFRTLVEAGPEGLPAGVLAERLGVAPPTLSFHLRTLVQAGLLSSARTGRSIAYAANYDAMNALVGYLTDNCCGGQPDKCRPRPKRGGGARSSSARSSSARSKG